MNEQQSKLEHDVLAFIITNYDNKICRDAVMSLAVSDFMYYAKVFDAIKADNLKSQSFLELSSSQNNRIFEMMRKQEMFSSDISTAYAIPGHVERLKEFAVNRRITEKVMELYKTGDINLAEIRRIAESENDVSIASEAKATANIDKYINSIGKKQPKIYTGFERMDKFIGGFRIPSVVHIGARPSTGKTAFALNIAMEQSQRTAIFSLEMSSEQIFERIAANVADIDYGDINNCNVSADNQDKIKFLMQAYREGKRYFVFDDIYSVEGIAKAVSDISPKVVIVDYIQKVTTEKKCFNVREQIEEISTQLKRIAKYNNCVVIALSQLSRDGKDKPTMNSLKESGALEADGDYIMLLHRPYVLDKNDPSVTPEQTELILDKNKFGRTGIIKLRFDGKYQRFTETKHAKKIDDL